MERSRESWREWGDSGPRSSEDRVRAGNRAGEGGRSRAVKQILWGRERMEEGRAGEMGAQIQPWSWDRHPQRASQGKQGWDEGGQRLFLQSAWGSLCFLCVRVFELWQHSHGLVKLGPLLSKFPRCNGNMKNHSCSNLWISSVANIFILDSANQIAMSMAF